MLPRKAGRPDGKTRTSSWLLIGGATLIMVFLWMLSAEEKPPAASHEASPGSQRSSAAHDSLVSRVASQVLRAEENPERAQAMRISEEDDTPEPPLGRAPTAEDYMDMYKKQIAYCGEICTVDKAKLPRPPIPTTVESLKRSYISRPVRCATFFSKRAESLFDGERLEWPPPKSPPVPFTVHNERLNVWYFQDQLYSGATALAPKWDTAKLNADVELAKKRLFRGTYGRNATWELHDFLEKYGEVEGKRVLVVGTEHPWVETLILKLGAREVVTLEYGRIETDHPRLKTMLPLEANDQFRRGVLEPFDMVVSFSSLEHSGLGRYGDMLNPWGDVIWMAKLSCMVKPGGYAVVAMEDCAEDIIHYNAHRCYGPYRWPLFLQNWEAKQAKRLLDHFRHGLVLAVNRRAE